MNKVKIITDSCCSLSTAELERMDVDWAQMTIMIDGELYNAYEHPTKDPDKFYNNLKSVKKCSTGCVNIQTFTDLFEKWAHNGYDVVYMGLSSGLSSTYDNAMHAAEHVNKTCGKHIWVADTLSGSFGIAYMVQHACKLAAEGKSAEEIYNAINKNKLRTICYFMPLDLQFLANCGRLNKIVAGVGTMLKLVPILANNEEGKLKMIAKSIGRKKALKTLQSLILNTADLNKAEKIYIGHTGQAAEAELMADFIKQNTQNKDVEVGWLDYTMGCSCGPNTLAVFVSLK